MFLKIKLIGRQVVFVPKFTDFDETKATLERVADHIDYIGKRCGRAHVGISSDFGESPFLASRVKFDQQMGWITL